MRDLDHARPSGDRSSTLVGRITSAAAHRRHFASQSPPGQRGSDQFSQHLVPQCSSHSIPGADGRACKVMVDEFPQTRATPVPGEGGRQEQAGIGHPARWSSKRMRHTVLGFVLWQRSDWVLLVSGRVSVPRAQAIIPCSSLRGAPFWLPSRAVHPRPSFGGFGLRRWTRY